MAIPALLFRIGNYYHISGNGETPSGATADQAKTMTLVRLLDGSIDISASNETILFCYFEPGGVGRNFFRANIDAGEEMRSGNKESASAVNAFESCRARRTGPIRDSMRWFE